jgi:hypothetical protein
MFYIKGGVNVYTGNGKVNDDTDPNPIVSETQLHNFQHMALFFLEKDLHHGTKMNMKFKKNSNYGKNILASRSC